MQPAYIFHLYKFRDYINFLNNCKDKIYDNILVIHKHHIYPRYLKLNEIELNNQIVRLSVEDHITAHIMFAECFNKDSKESISSLRAAKLLSKNSIKYKNEFEKIYDAQRGDLNPSKLPENKIKISQGLKNFYKNNNNAKKGKTYKEIYGDSWETEILKRSKSTRSLDEYKLSAAKANETKNKNNTTIKGNTHKWSKPVTIKGVTYVCMREAREKLGISHFKLKQLLQ